MYTLSPDTLGMDIRADTLYIRMENPNALNIDSGTLKSQALYVTISDAARIAGLSRSTIYRMIEDRVLTVYRPTRGTRRISRAELIAQVERP